MVYAPAQYSPRDQFFRDLLAMPLFNFSSSTTRESLSSLSMPLDSDPSNLSPMLMMGDFNYHATSYLTDNSNDLNLTNNNTNTGAAIHRHFHQTINTHFFECTHSRDESALLPTHRGDFLGSSWTDHTLPQARFIFSSDRQGPGLWRANPTLSTNPYFIDQLFAALDAFFSSLEIIAAIDTAASIPPASPHDNWDALMAMAQHIARRISRYKSNILERQCKRLQRKKNRICRQYSNPRLSTPLLLTIGKQIGIIQRETATNL